MKIRKRIADGGTAPHVGSCSRCGAMVFFHRSGAGTVTLDLEPVAAEAVQPDVATRYVLMAGTATEALRWKLYIRGLRREEPDREAVS